MIRLTNALNAWRTADFEKTLKEEIQAVDPRLLPLQQGLSQTSVAIGDDLKVMIIRVSEEPSVIYVKTGIFYSGIIAGCSCADDPTPISEQTEYCELQFDIDKKTAETRVTLLSG